MSYYINKRAKDSKAFTIDILDIHYAIIHQLKDPFIAIKYGVETKTYQIIKPTHPTEIIAVQKQIDKAVGFAKKNIISK